MLLLFVGSESISPKEGGESFCSLQLSLAHGRFPIPSVPRELEREPSPMDRQRYDETRFLLAILWSRLFSSCIVLRRRRRNKLLAGVFLAIAITIAITSTSAFRKSPLLLRSYNCSNEAGGAQHFSEPSHAVLQHEVHGAQKRRLCRRPVEKGKANLMAVHTIPIFYRSFVGKRGAGRDAVYWMRKSFASFDMCIVSSLSNIAFAQLTDHLSA